MNADEADDPKNVCGPAVRRFRERREWSQTELAAACQLAGWDISRDTVAWIEARKRWVGDFELRTLSRVLQVPIADLVPDEIA